MPQAQVGIGLSLLQALVGMGSDSDSGYDYDDSDDESAGKTKLEIEAEAYFIALGKPVKHDRTSVAASESTVAGLSYASGEEDQGPSQISSTTDKGRDRSLSANASLSPTSNVFGLALLSPAASPTVSKFPPAFPGSPPPFSQTHLNRILPTRLNANGDRLWHRLPCQQHPVYLW